MTTERKPIMDEDLARIELDLSALDPDAAEYHWIAAAHVRRLLKALPALVAEVRELREALADALAELMDAIPFGAGLDLEAAGVAPRRANVIRRAARILNG